MSIAPENGFDETPLLGKPSRDGSERNRDIDSVDDSGFK
jgi:hypothetical protein